MAAPPFTFFLLQHFYLRLKILLLKPDQFHDLLICPFHFSSFVKRIFAIRICYVAHDQSLILLHSVRKTDLLISIRSSFYQISDSTAARSIPRPFIYRSINALNPFTPSASGASVLPSFPLKTFSSRKSARSSPSFLLII